MKRLKTTMLVGLSMLTCVTSAHANEFEARAQKVAALYKSGVTALNKGEVETARQAFTGVLKLQPNHGHARYQLAQLPITAKRVRLQHRKAQFKNTQLANIEMADASLAEAIEGLSVLTANATKKKFNPNFIIQDPKGKLADKKINLNMRNVPLSVALKYVLDMAGATVRYDDHATVIRPQ